MKQKTLKVALTLASTAILFAGFASSPVSGVGRKGNREEVRQGAEPITITVKTPPAEIMQGEPLIIKYEIANAADGAIVASRKILGEDWLDVRLVANDGTEIEALPPPEHDSPKRNQKRFTISGQSRHVGYRVAGR